jgi:hypothetical protein
MLPVGVLSQGKSGLLSAIDLSSSSGVEIQGFDDARALDLANEKRPQPREEMKKSRKKP